MTDHARRLEACLRHARHMSVDPNTQVGAMLVCSLGDVVTYGHNAFPAGIVCDERLHDRAAKLRLIIHAEMWALMEAAAIGRVVEGSTLYVASTDGTGAVWGGVCVRCAVHVIQAGVERVVTFRGRADSKWADEHEESKRLFAEAGVEYVEVEAA